MIDLSRRRFLKGAAAIAGCLPFTRIAGLTPAQLPVNHAADSRTFSISIEFFGMGNNGASFLMCRFDDICLKSLGHDEFYKPDPVSAEIKKEGTPVWYKITSSSGKVLKSCGVDSSVSSFRWLYGKWLGVGDTIRLSHIHLAVS
jgi:hypothetical protein